MALFTVRRFSLAAIIAITLAPIVTRAVAQGGGGPPQQQPYENRKIFLEGPAP